MNLKKYLFVLLILTTFFTLFSCSVKQSTLPKVKEVNLENIDPSLFSEEEWYMPYYLKHFAAVANSVEDTGANRGYFDLSVWRGSRNHHTYNARIMEGILSLVWFYCTDRPWNVYYNDQNLKKRIEASLEFWCSIQNEDGRFSEYRVGQWSLAPTAFASKFIGRALWLIDQGPKIDETVYENSRIALRKAIYIGFTHEGLMEHGRSYTNQYANLWGGALSYLAVWPDEEIESLLKQRFKESMTEFQGPAGFFYEKDGPDWGYNLNTHHSDLQVAWEYADDELRALIIEKTKAWYDWFSYNAVKEPGSMSYFLNRAIETRQQKGYYISNQEEDPAYQRWVPQAEFIPVTHAFEMSESEVKAERNKHYQAMLDNYPEVAELEVGEFNAFTPYAFLHHNMQQWHPDVDQKQKAIAKLPCNRDSAFIHMRYDKRSETKYIFVKTPSYYATFNHGKIITKQQRFGLGLIWNREMGTVFQSQSKTDKAAYGTKMKGQTGVVEANDLLAELTYNSKAYTHTKELVDLKKGKMEVRYPLGDTGEKSVVFEADRIAVDIRNKGEISEYLPLLITTEDQLTINGESIKLTNSKGEFIIAAKNAKNITRENFESDLNMKKCQVIKLSSDGDLSYEIKFN